MLDSTSLSSSSTGFSSNWSRLNSAYSSSSSAPAWGPAECWSGESPCNGQGQIDLAKLAGLGNSGLRGALPGLDHHCRKQEARRTEQGLNNLRREQVHVCIGVAQLQHAFQALLIQTTDVNEIKDKKNLEFFNEIFVKFVKCLVESIFVWFCWSKFGLVQLGVIWLILIWLGQSTDKQTK